MLRARKANIRRHLAIVRWFSEELSEEVRRQAIVTPQWTSFQRRSIQGQPTQHQPTQHQPVQQQTLQHQAIQHKPIQRARRARGGATPEATITKKTKNAKSTHKRGRRPSHDPITQDEQSELDSSSHQRVPSDDDDTSLHLRQDTGLQPQGHHSSCQHASNDQHRGPNPSLQLPHIGGVQSDEYFWSARQIPPYQPRDPNSSFPMPRHPSVAAQGFEQPYSYYHSPTTSEVTMPLYPAPSSGNSGLIYSPYYSGPSSRQILEADHEANSQESSGYHQEQSDNGRCSNTQVSTSRTQRRPPPGFEPYQSPYTPNRYQTTTAINYTQDPNVMTRTAHVDPSVTAPTANNSPYAGNTVQQNSANLMPPAPLVSRRRRNAESPIRPARQASRRGINTAPSPRMLSDAARLAEVNGVVSPSRVPPGQAPIQPTNRPSNFDPTRPRDMVCPRCRYGFNRKYHMQSHFPACIGVNGNPLGLRWDDGLTGKYRFHPSMTRANTQFFNQDKL